jgi:hypothetical protein
MGWFFKSDSYLKMTVGMQYDTVIGYGIASVEIEVLGKHARLGENELKISAAALLYGRTLVNHAETRTALFERVGTAANALIQGSEKFTTTVWDLKIAGRSFRIWPWEFSQTRLNKAKNYVATVQRLRGDDLGINLKMAFGLERVLAPSAPLIAISTVVDLLKPNERVLLGHTLACMNVVYETPEGASYIMSDATAFNAAFRNVRRI